MGTVTARISTASENDLIMPQWIHERTLKTMVKGGVLHHVLVKRYDGK
jgi:hypothetical protein